MYLKSWLCSMCYLNTMLCTIIRTPIFKDKENDKEKSEIICQRSYIQLVVEVKPACRYV